MSFTSKIQNGGIVLRRGVHLPEGAHSARCDSARKWLQKNQARLYRPLVHALDSLKPEQIQIVEGKG